MESESGAALKELRVDGGASRSPFLMQYQANINNTNVLRPKCLETTALGSAMLAGLAVGMWKDLEELSKVWDVSIVFKADYDENLVNTAIKRWHRAVKASMGWAKPE